MLGFQTMMPNIVWKTLVTGGMSRMTLLGETSDPSINADMISPAFWVVGGSEFKITRSDDFTTYILAADHG